MRDAPPAAVSTDGPAFGTYAGRVSDTDLRLGARGVGRLRRALSEKRRQWFAAFDDRLAVGSAVVDTGVLATAFLWVADRARGELLVDADVGMLASRYRQPFGTWTGTVADRDVGGHGVAERHTARW